MCLSWHGGRSVRKWKRSHIVVGFPVYEGANCSDHGGVAAAWRDMGATCRRRAARTINGAVSRWRGRAEQRAAELGAALRSVPLIRPAAADTTRVRPKINLALMKTGGGGRRQSMFDVENGNRGSGRI